MKKLICFCLVLSAYAAVFGQQAAMPADFFSPQEQRVDRRQLQSAHPSGHTAYKGARVITLDYDISDQYQVDSVQGGVYKWNYWSLNTNYVESDTNRKGLQWAVVVFDTLYDAVSRTGFPADSTPYVLDSIKVLFNHKNLTGTPDTIVISVYEWTAPSGLSVNSNDEITNPSIFSESIITDSSLTPTTETFVFTLKPHLQVPANKRFLVGVHFYGDTVNTLGIVAGYGNTCSGACYASPSVIDSNSFYKVIIWNFPQNGSGINPIVLDCNQNSIWGEPGECELMNIQNFSIISYLSEGIISGQPEKLSINSLKVYPNPGNGRINVELPLAFANNAQIKILNLFGEVLFESRATGQPVLEMNFSGFPAGIYFIKAETPTETAIEKIVIE